jgi:hypothetical protein
MQNNGSTDIDTQGLGSHGCGSGNPAYTRRTYLYRPLGVKCIGLSRNDEVGGSVAIVFRRSCPVRIIRSRPSKSWRGKRSVRVLFGWAVGSTRSRSTLLGRWANSSNDNTFPKGGGEGTTDLT